jgi:hypothetical protein
MLANLRVLFGRLIDIILLRGGPEQLPASAGILAFTVFLNAAVFVLVVSLVPTLPALSPFELFVSTVVPLLWFQVAFALVRKPERFAQTMTAFFGVNALFQPLVVPLSAALLPYMQKQDPTMPPPAAPSLLLLAISLWMLIVLVRIVRDAFEWRYFQATVFVFAQKIAVFLVYATVFGVPSGKV